RAAAAAGVEALHHQSLADMGLGDDEIVDVELVVVLRVGDRRLEALAHLLGDALAREFEIGERGRDLLAADQLRQQIELLRAHAQHLGDRFGLVLGERAGMARLAHILVLAYAGAPGARLALRSAEWPWNVRVGENSPNLWPTISSVTSTGMCLWPL